MAKVIVVFAGSWRGYSKGEVAGFEENVAQSLIEGGRAELHDGKKTGKSGGGKGKPAPAKEPTQSGPSTEPPPNPDSTTTDPDDDEEKP